MKVVQLELIQALVPQYVILVQEEPFRIKNQQLVIIVKQDKRQIVNNLDANLAPQEPFHHQVLLNVLNVPKEHILIKNQIDVFLVLQELNQISPVLVPVLTVQKEHFLFPLRQYVLIVLKELIQVKVGPIVVLVEQEKKLITKNQDVIVVPQGLIQQQDQNNVLNVLQEHIHGGGGLIVGFVQKVINQMKITQDVIFVRLVLIHLLIPEYVLNAQKELFQIGVIHRVLLVQKDITVIPRVHLNVKDVLIILILI